MKKYLVYGKFLLAGLVFLPLLLGCTTLEFYDRQVSMKKSCVIEYNGDDTITLILNDEVQGERKEIHGFSGINTLIIPVGTYTFAYSSEPYKNAIDAKNRSDQLTGRSYWYTWKSDVARSESTTLEASKRYKAERVGNIITITEMENGGISGRGVTTPFKFSLVANGLGWRYSGGFLFGEFGPQIGVSVASDAMVMNITGEATMGMGIFGGENNGFGFPYRAGGSVTTFFGKSKFGLGLGGGITGQTIMLLGNEGNDMFPKMHVPYIQVKGLFHPDRNNFLSFGLFMDYYPTVTPVDFGAFGLGFAVNY